MLYSLLMVWVQEGCHLQDCRMIMLFFSMNTDCWVNLFLETESYPADLKKMYFCTRILFVLLAVFSHTRIQELLNQCNVLWSSFLYLKNKTNNIPQVFFFFFLLNKIFAFFYWAKILVSNVSCNEFHNPILLCAEFFSPQFWKYPLSVALTVPPIDSYESQESDNSFILQPKGYTF